MSKATAAIVGPGSNGVNRMSLTPIIPNGSRRLSITFRSYPIAYR